MSIEVGSFIQSLDELYEIENKLVILNKEKHKKVEGYKVYYIGEYDVSKVGKYVEDRHFFPYYNGNIVNIAEAIKSPMGVNTHIKATVLDEDSMAAAGFVGKKKMGKKVINSPEYFCYKAFDFPGMRDVDISMLVTINKTTSAIKIALADGLGQPYDYREIINNSKGSNKTAQLAMMQLEFWMAYFESKGILSGHTYGEFII